MTGGLDPTDIRAQQARRAALDMAQHQQKFNESYAIASLCVNVIGHADKAEGATGHACVLAAQKILLAFLNGLSTSSAAPTDE